MKVRHAVLGGALALLLALAATGARADELPAEKAGLWETKMKMSAPGVPQMHEMTTRRCAGAAAVQDKERAAALAKARLECSKMDIRKTATGFVQESVCKGQAGMTVTSHVEISGDFNTAYTMKNTSHVEIKGGKAQDTSMVMENKWLGACPAGSAPGRVVDMK